MRAKVFYKKQRLTRAALLAALHPGEEGKP
jgi:hypothetical protein